MYERIRLFTQLYQLLASTTVPSSSAVNSSGLAKSPSGATSSTSWMSVRVCGPSQIVIVTYAIASL